MFSEGFGLINARTRRVHLQGEEGQDACKRNNYIAGETMDIFIAA